MRISGFFRWLMAAVLVLGLAGTCLASAQEEYAQAVATFKSLLENEKKAGLRAEWLALAKKFERSLAADPKGESAPKAMYFIGRSYEELARRSFNRTDRRNALDAFDRMLAAFPKHSWADDSLYRKGLIFLELSKDAAQAHAAFTAVINTYPRGDMAAEAGQRLAAMGQQPPAAPAKAETLPKASAAPTGKQTSPPPAAQKEPASAASATASRVTLMGIRHWSSDEYTRVVMDVTDDVRYERALVEKTSNGNKQLQISLQQAGIDAGVMPTRAIQDGILSHIHVGADNQGNALVSIDLMQMDHYRVFTLPDPYRVVLDIYGSNGGKTAAPAKTAGAAKPAEAAPATGGGTEDKDHVVAALTELQARKESAAVQKDPPKQEAPPKKQDAPKAKESAAPKQAAPAAEPAKTPEIAVTSKQKKYAGSLVEQLGLKVRTIMIDPGHGGKDPGAMANGLQEKDINLRMAKILGKMLGAQGFDVHYTRTTDKFIPLEERTALANAKNADLFISIHCNSYKDASIKGLEVYYLNLATDAQAVRVAARENGVSAKKISDMQFILSDLMLNSKINESRQMAALVEKETLRTMRPKHPLTSHGAKGAFFYVLTGARMPSILVEMGYLTNPGEAAKLNSDEYLAAMARGLTAGVVAYKNKLEKYSLAPSGKS